MTEITNENPEIRESAEMEVTEVAQATSPVQPKADDFDWDSLESGMDTYTAHRRDELENLSGKRSTGRNRHFHEQKGSSD